MDEIEQILWSLERNEEIAEKFFEVEASILSIFEFKDFFERLLTEIRDKFKIPYVWLTMIEESDAAFFIHELAASEVVASRLKLIEKTRFINLIGDNGRPILVNEDLGPFYKLFPANASYLIRSLAVAPIRLENEMIGSLNFGDPSDIRYFPGMDTSLLERLAAKVSICLTNVLAHEKLKAALSGDPLTGLMSRLNIEAILRCELQRADRHNAALSFVLIKVRNLHDVMVQHGREAGNDLMKRVADQLLEVTQGGDSVGRLAGDLFGVVLPLTSFQDAESIKDRLEQLLKKSPFVVDRETIAARFRYGIIDFENSGVPDPAVFIDRAEEKLHETPASLRKKEGPFEKNARL